MTEVRIAIGRQRKFPTIKALAEKCRIPYNTLYKRLHRTDMTPTEAVRMPVRKYRKA